ncbi:DUF2946 family protein [Pseudomonas luteola]|uniref:DUF2946 family protein n=1 Tax=Pseudomonas luteola TaxID=47886 RepID=UPI003A84A6B2
MKYVRTHRSLIAWMLYAFILFNGLACSIGHGQMLGELLNTSGLNVMDCSGHNDSSANTDMSDAGDHGLLMKLSMSDCAFAGTLALSIVFFLGLSSLIAAARSSRPLVESFKLRPSRYLIPGLAPQAP